MKTVLLIVVLGVFLAVSIWFAAQAWIGVDTQMSGHGWFALILGAVLSIVVGVVLMGLVFISARRGYDDVDHEL
ncbi:MAG: hypothetical protein AAFX09_13430 [Pseudomonadota bacterium]